MKRIIAMTAALLLSTAIAVASPPPEFKKGAVDIEVGGTLNSRLSASGRIDANVKGESGFKYAIVTGLNDRLSVQFKQGLFKSVNATILGITTYAQAEPTDLNLLYKLSPQLTLIAGYEHTKISYGKAVEDASHSSFHLGLTATQPLNDKTTLFATVVAGNNALLREFGVSRKLSPISNFSISYAIREVKDLNLSVPPAHIRARESYKMSGYTCMLGFKL